MKRVLVAIFALVVAVSISACGANQPEKVDNTDSPQPEKVDNTDSPSRFVIVEYADAWYIAADKDTRVMYVVSDGYYNRGTFTLLVNADGTPLVYEGEL